MNKLSIKRNIVWKSFKWPEVAQRVRRMQRRIYRASKANDKSLVQKLQKLLITSYDAKLLAVHTVTTLNKGKKTAGVDDVKIITDSGKEKLVGKVSLSGKANPIRRVWIPKPGKSEKRPLGIPTILDRANQALAKFALEPEWEAKFEANSYGFRPGRGCHDAIEAIFLALRHKKVKWVFDADIRKCFDRINHQSLIAKLETFPQMENQIRAWLEADIMEGYASSPKSISKSAMGTPQGGVISPLLANIALHGLENHLKEFVSNLTIKVPDMGRGKLLKRKALQVIRYADDFVIIHQDRRVLGECIKQTKQFLNNMGLEVSEEKSKVKKGNQGFLFLGFQIIQVKKGGEYKVKIMPSKAAQKEILKRVSTILAKAKAASSYDLISSLRPVLLGWANYYKYSECSLVFRRITHQVFLKLRAWVFRRDTRNGRRVVKEKYFPSGRSYKFDGTIHHDNWVLVAQKINNKGKLVTSYLPHMVWVKSKKHVKVKGEKSPFDNDYLYWAERSEKYSILPTRTRTLLSKQKFVCKSCNKKFTTFDKLEIDHIIPKAKGGKDTYDNLQVLHITCHQKKTAKEYKD